MAEAVFEAAAILRPGIASVAFQEKFLLRAGIRQNRSVWVECPDKTALPAGTPAVFGQYRIPAPAPAYFVRASGDHGFVKEPLGCPGNGPVRDDLLDKGHAAAPVAPLDSPAHIKTQVHLGVLPKEGQRQAMDSGVAEMQAEQGDKGPVGMEIKLDASRKPGGQEGRGRSRN